MAEDNKAAALEWKAKGNAALGAKDFPTAIEHYTKAIELDGSQHVFFSNRSAAYLSSGDAAKALEDAEECVKLAPSWAKGFTRKGQALQSLNRLEEALDAYEAGLKLDPSNAALSQGRAAVANQLMAAQNPFSDAVAWCMTDPRFRPHMDDASFRSKVEMLQAAGIQALGSVASDPRIMELLSAKLGINLTPPPEDAAPAATSRSTSSSSSSGDGDQAKAGQQAAKQEQEEEEEEEEEELTEEEKAERAEAARKQAEADKAKAEGNALYKQRKFDEAVACYDRAIALLPEELTYRLNKAAALFEAGSIDDAVALCEEAIENGREQRPVPFAKIAKAFARIGSAKLKAGDVDAALEAFESAQAESFSDAVEKKIKVVKKRRAEAARKAYIDPAKALAAKEEGNTAFKAGDFKAAIDHYSEAIKRDPENAVYWTNRATARCKLMDFGGAMDDVKKAIAAQPDYVKAYARKARIEMFSKQLHIALDTATEGLEKEPDNTELLQVMSELQAQINAAMFAPPDPVRQQRAMQDPEIQGIMRDPMVQQALSDLGTDPTAMQKIAADPAMNRKINRLILAGVVSFGSPASAAAASSSSTA